MCDREVSKIEAALASKGLSSHWKKKVTGYQLTVRDSQGSDHEPVCNIVTVFA
jgi:hypothetical protein